MRVLDNFLLNQKSISLNGFLIGFTTVFCLFISQPVSANDLLKSHATETKVYNLCKNSSSLVRQRQFESAISKLKQAAKFDPTTYSATVHLRLATCYRHLKRYKTAIIEAKQALNYDPGYSEVYYELALISYNSKKYADCRKYLSKLVAQTKNSSLRKQAKNLLSEVDVYSRVDAGSDYLKAGKYSSAVQELEKAVKYDPSRYSSTVHSGLAFAYGRIGKSERAISEGKKALQFDPTDKNTVYNTVIAYQDIANFDKAIEWLNKYLTMERDPQRRKAAATFLIELKQDSKLYNSQDNKQPDYLKQMSKKNGLVRWRKDAFPLKVFIHSGTGVRGYRKKFDNYILNSLDTWCEASGRKLSYKVVASPAMANLEVKWKSKALQGSNLQDHRIKAGLTNLRWNSQKQIKKAVVSILTVEAFNPRKVVKSGVCASVCMHEVGHALGLDHSSYIYDVMYFRSSSKQTGRPTKRDRATIAKLYANYPVLGFKPHAKPVSKGKIKYLPPPTFLPPSAPKTGKIKPPLFMPPPKPRKLTPPLFKPPPKTSRPNAPTFLPPKKSKTKRPRKSRPPTFLPPPIKKK